MMPTPDISIANVKTLESKIVYQNKWMTVREDVVQRENGTTGIFGIVEKPDFAVIAAIENGNVCLVEQHRYPVRFKVLGASTRILGINLHKCMRLGESRT